MGYFLGASEGSGSYWNRGINTKVISILEVVYSMYFYKINWQLLNFLMVKAKLYTFLYFYQLVFSLFTHFFIFYQLVFTLFTYISIMMNIIPWWIFVVWHCFGNLFWGSSAPQKQVIRLCIVNKRQPMSLYIYEIWAIWGNPVKST